ncbi:MAG: AAA family ATPase [Acetatifactor sp.]|nr:AAA family ATPase [Acetatifactor sp.]
MEEGFSKGGYDSLEEHMQEYAAVFLWLQQGEDRGSVLFEERRSLLDARERETMIFLPAVCLREKYFLTQTEYWIMMFAFCCELDGGLCMDFRNRYKENRPNLQYILHLLSQVMPVGFSDVSELCGKNGVLRDILYFVSEEEEEAVGREERSFLQLPLRINSVVFYFLLTGGLYRENWYSLYPVAEEEGMPGGRELLPLHESEYGRLCGYLGAEEPLRILLHGSRGSGSHILMRRVCGEIRSNVLFFRSDILLHASKSRRSCILQVLRLIGTLWNPVTVVELAEEFSDASASEWENIRRELLQDLGDRHLCFLAQTGAQAEQVKEDADVRISLKEELSMEEKRLLLDAWVAPEDRRQWQDELLEHYRLNVGEWKRRQRRISILARAGAYSLADRRIWLEVMGERGENFRFGKLIEDRFEPDEIILPADCRRQLETVVRLAGAWRGKRGLQLLFHGSSGTGKTMAASVIAGQLQLPLLKVDLSQVFDKYIGETEKHIDEIFRTARRNQYLLFFDEADALFAKRTAVRDSHDRYANVSASFLLQRMEEYDGIVILATNLKDHFDDAFVRRIRFVVRFRNPGREDRERLWRKVLEGGLPVAQDVDFGALAEAAELSPARISAAAHVAKLLAACDGRGAVARDHLREALVLEAGKDETVIRGF